MSCIRQGRKYARALHTAARGGRMDREYMARLDQDDQGTLTKIRELVRELAEALGTLWDYSPGSPKAVFRRDQEGNTSCEVVGVEE